MAFGKDFIRESSERSDNTNWAKKQLIQAGDYYFEAIEGCNQNDKNLVTILMERANVFCDDGCKDADSVVLTKILRHEGAERITRLINFAKLFSIPLTYILYSYECGKVWRYSLSDIDSIAFEEEYVSFEDFSDWIQIQKGWKSYKEYREIQDLPQFDIALRERGCAWPTNIDCIAFSKGNVPLAIIEFQNAKKTHVRLHCNNEHFLFCDRYYNQETQVYEYKNDSRRWLSQEILRIQSGLRLFVITWAQNDTDYIIKEIEKITFPDIPHGKGTFDEAQTQKNIYHDLITKKDHKLANYVSQQFGSYNLSYMEESNTVLAITHNPPLSYKEKTFPYIYYKFKQMSFGYPDSLPVVLSFFIENQFVVKCSD